jgi:hypothetical protein
MADNKIQRIQVADQFDNPVMNASDAVLITSSTTTTIFSGIGVLIGVGIWKDVDGGTIYFTDIDDDPIDGLPNSTAKGVTDYAGTFPVARLELTNGLKVVTESTTGIVMSVFSFFV